MGKSSNSGYLMKLTIVATLGGLLFGYDTGVIAGTVGSLDRFFVEPKGLEESAANILLGFLVSIGLAGCVLGGAISGWISTKFGRKNGLIISAILLFISALGSAMPEMLIRPIGQADHTFHIIFMIYRVIGGVGVGLASMLSPVYIAEIAPADKRGQLVSYNQLAIVAGFVVVYFVNYFIAKGGGSDEWLDAVGWKWMFASEIIPAGVFLALLFFIPDTPRSLVLRGKEEEAKAVLLKVNGEDGVTIIEEIKASLNQTEVSGKLFSYGAAVIFIGIGLSAFQQLVGINVILYYATEIFKNINPDTDGALLSQIIVGIANFLFTIIAIKTVDKYGRKPLMLIGALGMSIAMFSLGFVFYAQASGVLALICMLTFVASFAMSWGPITWVLLSEMFPNAIRGRALAIAVALQWIVNFLVSTTFPMMDKNTFLSETFHNGFAYWLYGFFGALAFFFVKKYVPETKGKTLEEMENLWKK